MPESGGLGGSLDVVDLHAHYGESHVLHGVSFDVKRGEVVTLLGRNGAGKTTTLKSIMGIIKERSGSIRFNGTEMIASYEIARLGVAYCPEERGIFASLSVEENLLLPPVVQPGGMSVGDIFVLFPNIRERRRSVGTKLSGGEQQMLAIARILRTGATLLLLDEPTERSHRPTSTPRSSRDWWTARRRRSGSATPPTPPRCWAKPSPSGAATCSATSDRRTSPTPPSPGSGSFAWSRRRPPWPPPLALGQHREVVGRLQELVAAHPFHERLLRAADAGPVPLGPAGRRAVGVRRDQAAPRRGARPRSRARTSRTSRRPCSARTRHCCCRSTPPPRSPRSGPAHARLGHPSPRQPPDAVFAALRRSAMVGRDAGLETMSGGLAGRPRRRAGAGRGGRARGRGQVEARGRAGPPGDPRTAPPS